jgi:hypothetical protein
MYIYICKYTCMYMDRIHVARRELSCASKRSIQNPRKRSTTQRLESEGKFVFIQCRVQNPSFSKVLCRAG